MLYKFFKNLGIGILKIFRGIKLQGVENLPVEENYLIIANHRTIADPFIVAAASKKPLSFIGKEELFRNKFLTKFFNHLNTFKVDRSGDPRALIKMSIDMLQNGRSMVIFPEGTRNKGDDSILPFKKGAALIAIKAGVKVVPCAIIGSDIKGAPILGRFGKPITPPEKYSKAIVEDFRTQLENAVRELIEIDNNKTSKKFVEDEIKETTTLSIS